MPPLLSACSSEVRRCTAMRADDTLMRPAQDPGIAAAARAAAEAVLLAVDESSVSEVVRELLRGLEDGSAGCRAATATLSGSYFKSLHAALEEHVPVILGA